METSAKDGTNIQELFRTIGKAAINGFVELISVFLYPTHTHSTAENLPLDRIAMENKVGTLKLGRAPTSNGEKCSC